MKYSNQRKRAIDRAATKAKQEPMTVTIPATVNRVLLCMAIVTLFAHLRL
jgi:hypothetical protein